MDMLVAPVHHIEFDIEVSLTTQEGVQPLPFPGMDKSGAAVCELYVRSTCPNGTACPFRHVRGDKAVVCKHWLRGLCKKGDGCEFLHEYDMTKMPECYFYTKYNACHNKECPFLHVDPETKVKDCPWYDRGFCRHGALCRHRHVRKILCLDFLAGFCALGPSCREAHPRTELPEPDATDPIGAADPAVAANNNNAAPAPDEKPCAQCSASNPSADGHEASVCLPVQPRPSRRPIFYPSRRNLDAIVCFKCGENGHFANKCLRGPVSFLHLGVA